MNNDDEQDEPKEISLKDKIAQSAGVNPKTVERNTKALLLALFGVTEKELDEDIYLRKYLRWILYQEDPSPWIILEKTEPEKGK